MLRRSVHRPPWPICCCMEKWNRTHTHTPNYCNPAAHERRGLTTNAICRIHSRDTSADCQRLTHHMYWWSGHVSGDDTEQWAWGTLTLLVYEPAGWQVSISYVYQIRTIPTTLQLMCNSDTIIQLYGLHNRICQAYSNICNLVGATLKLFSYILHMPH